MSLRDNVRFAWRRLRRRSGTCPHLGPRGDPASEPAEPRRGLPGLPRGRRYMGPLADVHDLRTGRLL